MISIEILLTFIIATTLISFAPGPDNIFVLTQSAVNGAKAGLLVTLGLCTGLLVHTAAVVLGIAAIFQVSVLAFTTLKLVGACYLMYLAWQAFRASSAHLAGAQQGELSNMTLYKRGIIMNISNPKVALFFLAFLPQFATPSNGSISYQLLLLGGVFILVALIVFSFIAIISGLLNTWLTKSQTSQKILNYISGTVFIGLAIKLITTIQ